MRPYQQYFQFLLCRLIRPSKVVFLPLSLVVVCLDRSWFWGSFHGIITYNVDLKVYKKGPKNCMKVFLGLF